MSLHSLPTASRAKHRSHLNPHLFSIFSACCSEILTPRSRRDWTISWASMRPAKISQTAQVHELQSQCVQQPTREHEKCAYHHSSYPNSWRPVSASFHDLGDSEQIPQNPAVHPSPCLQPSQFSVQKNNQSLSAPLFIQTEWRSEDHLHSFNFSPESSQQISNNSSCEQSSSVENHLVPCNCLPNLVTQLKCLLLLSRIHWVSCV